MSSIFLVLKPDVAFTVLPCIGSQHHPTIKPDFFTALISGLSFFCISEEPILAIKVNLPA